MRGGGSARRVQLTMSEKDDDARTLILWGIERRRGIMRDSVCFRESGSKVTVTRNRRLLEGSGDCFSLSTVVSSETVGPFYGSMAGIKLDTKYQSVSSRFEPLYGEEPLRQ